MYTVGVTISHHYYDHFNIPVFQCHMSFLQTPVPALPLETSLLKCVKHEHHLDHVSAEILQTVWYAS